MEKRIGCSGYYYNHWKGIFYPEDLRKKDWLPFYSRFFNTVEINNTFYRMPLENAVKNWYLITPPDFVFAVKGYRYFSHLKRLIVDDDLRGHMVEFLKVISLLKEKLGPLLWQFPASFQVNAPRLEQFCKLLGTEFNCVFEFRHSSWFTQEIFNILRKHRHALCLVSAPSSVPNVFTTTSRLVYLRFHGEGEWYRHNYSNESLEEWKRKLDTSGAGIIYAYFNNDVNGYAVNNGRYLASLYDTDD